MDMKKLHEYHDTADRLETELEDWKADVQTVNEEYELQQITVKCLKDRKKSGQRIRLNTIDDALDQLEFLREKRAEYKKELKKVESKLKTIEKKIQKLEDKMMGL